MVISGSLAKCNLEASERPFSLLVAGFARQQVKLSGLRVSGGFLVPMFPILFRYPT